MIRRACEDFPAASGQIHYLTGHAGFPVYENNENGFDYYPLGDDGFPVILEELKKAQKFIFLEYFIIARGQMWDRMHEMLKQKAAEGLDVRVLYDDMGSFSTLPMSYAKTLQAEGIRCIPFNRISPVLGAIMNHRDHRKILVIDGKTAFSGGINLADEYINAIVRFGHPSRMRKRTSRSLKSCRKSQFPQLLRKILSPQLFRKILSPQLLRKAKRLPEKIRKPGTAISFPIPTCLWMRTMSGRMSI